jgi:UDP-N-acetylmuramoylalanine--D-glutamate ligase
VRHRLELVAEVDQVRYYNDSIATTPESTIAALDALGPEVVLICGGASKGCCFEELGAAARDRTRAVVVLGATADEIAAEVEGGDGVPEVARAEDLPAALEVARRLARPGDRVVLSPACASYDQFRNFEERGDLFRRLVSEIQADSRSSSSGRG